MGFGDFPARRLWPQSVTSLDIGRECPDMSARARRLSREQPAVTFTAPGPPGIMPGLLFSQVPKSRGVLTIVTPEGQWASRYVHGRNREWRLRCHPKRVGAFAAHVLAAPGQVPVRPKEDN